MKINYINEPSDDSFDDHMEKKNYSQSSKDIQHRWAKIRACKLELLKIYSEITCIEPPKNDYGHDAKEEWGICINSHILFPVPANLSACATGIVRKMRNNVPNKYDDGACKSCPYFIPRDCVKSRTNEEIAKCFNG